MKLLKTVLAITVLALVASCSGKKEEKKSVGSLENLPKWVIDPNVNGKLAAVGISPASKGGLKLQLAQAESDARANIAARIQTEVSRVTKDAVKKASIEGVEDVDQFFSQATKEVIKNLPLSGATRINIYKDPSSGELYVHMTLELAEVKNYLEAREKLFTDQLKKSNLSRERLQQAETAFQTMFDELNFDKAAPSKK